MAFTQISECGELRNGLNYSQQDEGAGLAILKVKDFKDHTLVPTSGLDELDATRVQLPPNLQLIDGDTVIIRSNGNGDLVGRCLFTKEVSRPTTFSGFCIRFRPNPKIIDPRFAFYVLKSPSTRERLVAHGSGTGIQSLNQETVGGATFMLPSRSEQEAISHLLGALDDKIELNLRTNQTLEALMATTFRSWFVDFDPVIAKAAGRKPRYLPNDIAQLFPSHFGTSALGPIPRGWEVQPIGNLVRIVGGSTPSTNEPKFWNGDVPWATPRDLAALPHPVLVSTERHITQSGLSEISSGLLPRGTVLLSSRAPIGYTAVAQMPLAVNQGFIALLCDGPLPNLYVLQWLKEHMELIENNANGTTFMEISKRNFRPILAVLPPTNLLNNFIQVVTPWWSQIVHNVHESLNLVALRDTLLPKLLSGELPLEALEEFLNRG